MSAKGNKRLRNDSPPRSLLSRKVTNLCKRRGGRQGDERCRDGGTTVMENEDENIVVLIIL